MFRLQRIEKRYRSRMRDGNHEIKEPSSNAFHHQTIPNTCLQKEQPMDLPKSWKQKKSKNKSQCIVPKLKGRKQNKENVDPVKKEYKE